MFQPSNTILLLILYSFGLLTGKIYLEDLQFWIAFFSLSILLLLSVFILKPTLNRSKGTALFLVSIFCAGGLNVSFYNRNNISGSVKFLSSVETRTFKGEVIEVNETAKKFSRALINLNNEYVAGEVDFLNENALLYFENIEGKSLELGDQVLFNSKIDRVKNFNNLGEFDAEWFWENKGVTLLMFAKDKEYSVVERQVGFFSFFRKIRDKLKAQLEKVLPPKLYSVSTALILGDKGLLNRETRNEFNTAGAMHVLAVSGLHVGILLLILENFFRMFKPLRKKNIFLLFAILGLWCYAFLTGLSPSVFRATLMFTFMAYGQFKGRSFFGLDIICFSAFVMLVINPLYLFDIGFQLSYCAMLSISLFYIPIKKFIYIKYSFARWIWEGLAVCFAAQIGTIPLTLYYFHQFPNYFLITNVGLIIFAFLCMASGVAYLSVSWMPFLNVIFGKILFFTFLLLVGLISAIDKLPHALAKGFQLEVWQVLIIYCLLLVLYFSWRLKNIKLWLVSCLSIFSMMFWVNTIRTTLSLDSHFTVLNHNSPLMILNNNDINYCFYDLLGKTNFDGTDFLADSYSKYVGGDVKFVDLTTTDVTMKLKGVELSIKYNPEYLGYDVDLNRDSYFLPTDPNLLSKEKVNIITRVNEFEDLESLNTLNLKDVQFKVKI